MQKNPLSQCLQSPSNMRYGMSKSCCGMSTIECPTLLGMSGVQTCRAHLLSPKTNPPLPSSEASWTPPTEQPNTNLLARWNFVASRFGSGPKRARTRARAWRVLWWPQRLPALEGTSKSGWGRHWFEEDPMHSASCPDQANSNLDTCFRWCYILRIQHEGVSC